MNLNTIEKTLNDVYYNPKTGFKSAAKLLKESLKKNKLITIKHVKEFLSNQEEVQINKNQNHYVSSELHITAPIGYYQADLAFYPKYKAVNKGYWIMLCVIEIPTRKAYIVPLKDKNDKTILQAFKTLKLTMKAITTDNGSEFINKLVEDYFKEHDVIHYLAQVDDHHKMAIVERFNRTIKNYLRKIFTADKSYVWYDKIVDVVYNYNHTFHSGINAEPANITEKRIEDLRGHAISHNMQTFANNGLSIGDSIRVRNKKNKFEKEGEQFGVNIYKIHAVDGYKYQVENPKTNTVLKKLYGADDIQKINSDVPSVKAVIGKDKRTNVVKEHKTKAVLAKEGIEKTNIVKTKRAVKKPAKFKD